MGFESSRSCYSPFSAVASAKGFTMVNVWLDDERNPNDSRIQELFGSEVGMVWVKTVHAAINRLKSNDVHWISLDHDLGTAATGYDLAKRMEERAFKGELRRSATKRGSLLVTA
jgi:hypothetical protein